MLKNSLIILFLIAAHILQAQGKFGGGDGAGYSSSAITNQPLPVALLYFKGQLLDNYILLQWATASEINNDRFTIEKSRDATNFRPIATIPGYASSTSTQAYEFVEKYPANGVNYYRLAQQDIDGQIHYSQIIAIRYFTDEALINIFPNPFDDLLTIQIKEEERPQSIRIYNVLGEVVFQASYIPEQINLQHLKSGLYYIIINGRSLTGVKQ